MTKKTQSSVKINKIKYIICTVGGRQRTNTAVRTIRTAHTWPVTHTRIKDNLQLLKFDPYKGEIKKYDQPK